MEQSIKIVDIESEDEEIVDIDSEKDSDSSVKVEVPDESSEGSNIIVYERKVLISIGELEICGELPANFEALVERFPDCDYIIFPSVAKPEDAEEDDTQNDDADEVGVLEYLRQIENIGVYEQIDKFMELVKVTQEQVQAMKDVSDALENVLGTEFPECKAFPFGSSASGLGLRGCDLDIHVELGPNVKDETFDVKAGMWGDRFKTRKVSDILRRKERFKSAVPIINARIPIIRLKERMTSIKCDINVVSRMGVKNTEYIALCSEYDPRCRPLIGILKYFSSKQEITGSGKGDHVNSYTLVLMVVFFLQTRNILHSVETLQNGIEEEEVEGWNFALCPDMDQLIKLELNTSSVLEILSEFFNFYQEFPFDTHVICPLVGEAITKNNIRHDLYLPSGRKKDKLDVNKVLVVQDPFELTRNVGHGVSRSRLTHMVEEFSTAKQLVDDLQTEEKQVKFWMLFEPGLCAYRDILATQYVPGSKVAQELHTPGGITVETLTGGITVKTTGGLMEDSLLQARPPGSHSVTRRDQTRPQSSSSVPVPVISIQDQARQFLFHHQSLRFPPPRL
eukprot:GFUD01028647.1.p1 GENE.GFUD01028647.1~~GFUD01028647.1.p1  ORF type:complete len:565 (+),score=163.95 GFUD01028647.1:54-1748(+)